MNQLGGASHWEERQPNSPASPVWQRKRFTRTRAYYEGKGPLWGRAWDSTFPPEKGPPPCFSEVVETRDQVNWRSFKLRAVWTQKGVRGLASIAARSAGSLCRLHRGGQFDLAGYPNFLLTALIFFSEGGHFPWHCSKVSPLLRFALRPPAVMSAGRMYWELAQPDQWRRSGCNHFHKKEAVLTSQAECCNTCLWVSLLAAVPHPLWSARVVHHGSWHYA